MRITCLSIIPNQVVNAIALRLGINPELIETSKQHGRRFDLVGHIQILNAQNPKSFDEFTDLDWDDFVNEHIEDIMEPIDCSRRYDETSIVFNIENEGYSKNDYLAFVNDAREFLNKEIEITDENIELIRMISNHPMFWMFGRDLGQELFKKGSNKTYLSFPDLSKENNNIYYEQDSRPISNTVDKELLQLKPSKIRISEMFNKSKNTNNVLNLLRERGQYNAILDLIDSSKSGLKERLSDVEIQFDNVNQLSNKTLYDSYQGRRAYYDSTNKVIHININAPYVNGDASSVIMHEIMHAVTLDLLKSNPEQAAKLRKIMDEYSKKVDSARYNTEHGLEEFVADIWSNEKVIEQLKSTKSDDGKASLWDKILDFFNDLFSGRLFENVENDSLMALASQELMKLLDMNASERQLGYYFEGENTIDASTISDKTADFGVVLAKHSKRDEFIQEAYDWMILNPSGLVAYRIGKYNTTRSVEDGIIGNPFNWQKVGTGVALQRFMDWLITGNNFGESAATPEFRQAIINKILSSNEETPILYYKDLKGPSHATVIGYLIRNKQLLQKQSNLDNYVKQFESIIGRFKERVAKPNDFEDTHKYYRVVDEQGNPFDHEDKKNGVVKIIDEDGNVRYGIEIEKSASKVIEDKKDENGKPTKNSQVATILGTDFDIAVRQYLKNGTIPSDTNFSESIISDIKNILESFKSQLDNNDNKYGKGRYRIITDEFPMAVKAYKIDKKTGKTVSEYIAGTTDMIVVTDDGMVHIFDMKTTSGDELNEASKIKYFYQLKMYKEMISSELRGTDLKIGDTGIFLVKLRYPNNFNNYSTDASGKITKPLKVLDRGQLKNLSELNSTRFYITPITNAIGDYITNLDYVENNPNSKNKVDYFSFESLVNEEDISQEDIDEFTQSFGPELESDNNTQSETNGDVGDFELEYKDFVDDNKYIPQDYRPVTHKEVLEIGRSTVKFVTWIAQKISKDSDGSFVSQWIDDEKYSQHEEGKAPMLYGMSIQEILKTDNLYMQLFKNVIDAFNYNDEDIPGTADFDKKQWIKDNWKHIMNNSFAELNDINGIRLEAHINKMTFTDVDVNDFQELYDLASGELDQDELAYDVDKKTVNQEEILPKQIKQRLSTMLIVKRDSNGNEILNEYGQPEYDIDENGMPRFLDKHYVSQVLYDNICSMKSRSDMISKLEILSEDPRYQWVKQVIELIDSDRHPDTYDRSFANVFFRTFRKSKNNYQNIINNEQGLQHQKYSLMPLGMKERSKKMIQKTNEFYQNGGSSLMLSKDENGKFSDSMKISLFEGFVSMLNSFEKNKTNSILAKEIIVSWLGLQIDNIDSITDQMLAKTKSKSVSDTIGSRLYKKFENLKNILAKQESEGIRLSDKEFSSELNEISKIIDFTMDDTGEISIRDGEKSYQTYSEPSFIQDTIDELNGSSDIENQDDRCAVLEDEKSKYNRFRQFRRYNSKGQVVYINSFLNRIMENKRLKRYLMHITHTSTNGNQYKKQGDKDYFISLIKAFFAPMENFNTLGYDPSEKVARFRVLMLSDKNSEEFVQFQAEGKSMTDYNKQRYEREFYHQFDQNVYEYCLYELERMKSVLYNLRHGKEDGRDDIDNYDIDRSKAPGFLTEKTEKIIHERNRNGDLEEHKVIRYKKITKEDLLDENGNFQDWFIKSGMSFRYLSYLNEEIKNGTEFGNAVLDLINNESLSDKRETVEGQKILVTPNEQYQSARRVISDQFNGLYKKYMEQQFNEFMEITKSMFEEDELEKVTQIFIDRGIKPYSEQGIRLLRWMYYNDNLAAMNIANMTVIDPAFNKDTIDFQKRFAQVHSQTQRCDKENTFDLNGKQKKYSDGKFRFAVIDDLIVSSELKPVVKQVFDDLYKKTGNIQYKILADTIPDMFDAEKKGGGVNVTDGQAYNSPTSLWKKLGMLGQDNPEFNDAYEKIRKGDFSIGNINIVLQTLKPFVYGFCEQFDDTNLASQEKTKLVPVQLKDSESLLILAGAIMEGAKVDSPLRAVFEIMEDSAFGRKEDHSLENYTGHGIDSFVFKSVVKVGGSGVLHIAGKSYAEAKEELQKCFKGQDYDDAYVHEMDFDAFGIQQNVPPHMQGHEQPLGSQERILAITDILDDDFKVTVNGVTYDKQTLVKEYGTMMKEDYGAGIFQLMRDFGAKKVKKDGKEYYEINRSKFNLHLSKLLTEKIVGDSKYSNELYRAFSMLFNTNTDPKNKKNDSYEFIVPIGDPTIANVVYSVLFTEIKRHVNELNVQGGPAVQMSVFGTSSELHITDSNGKPVDLQKLKDMSKEQKTQYLLKFYGNGLLFEAYVTAPTPEFEKAITKEDGSIMNMKEIVEQVKKGNISQEDFDNATKFISYRIPTEDKYSIFRCKVKGFIPRQQGELVVLPKDITLLSGTDFDVDKLYCWFRKTSKQISEMRDDRDKDRFKKRNLLYDLQWEVLGHKSSVEKQLYPGGYEQLKELAKIVNPDYKSGGQNIFFMQTQLALRKLNQAGKNFVGIAALNNVCHGMASFCGVKLKSLPNFTMQFDVQYEGKNGKLKKKTKTVSSFKSGKDITKITNDNGEFVFDPISSPFDDSRISRTLSMFVGASADNAKEALLGALNITPTTANYATTMIRMGIPIQMVVYIMNNPVVKTLSQQADNTGDRFESVIQEYYSKHRYNNDYTISEKELRQRIDTYQSVQDIEGQINKDGLKDIDKAVLKLLFDMTKICQDVQNMNSYLSLNSMKNNVGPTITDLFRKRMQIQRLMNDVRSDNSSFSNDAIDSINTNLPFMNHLWECYTSVIDKMCSTFSPLFNREFVSLLQSLYENGFNITQNNMTRLINGYLLFKAKTMNIFGKGENTIGGKRKEGETDLQYSERSRRLLLNAFVDRFSKVRDSYDWNDFIRSLKVEPMNAKNKTMAIKYNNSGSTRETNDDMSASWENFNDSGSTQEIISRMLFEYMVTRYGFSWMPDSASSIAPMDVKASIYQYKDIFNPSVNIFKSMTLADIQYCTFVDLLARNNPKCGLWKQTSISFDDEGEPILYVENYSEDQFGYASKYYKQLYVLQNKVIYTDENGREYLKLRQVYRLGIDNNFMEYDPDIMNMESILDSLLGQQTEEQEDPQDEQPEQSPTESSTDDSDLFANYGGKINMLNKIYERLPENSLIHDAIIKDLLSNYDNIVKSKSKLNKHIERIIGLIRGSKEIDSSTKKLLIEELKEIKKIPC